MLQSLALAGLAGVLAIAGTLVGQRGQAREARRTRAESAAREDLYRLHEKRQRAYIECYEAAGEARMAMSRGAPKPGEEADMERDLLTVRDGLWRALIPVRLIGDEMVAEAGRDLLRYVDAVRNDGLEFSGDDWASRISAFIAAGRRDLIK